FDHCETALAFNALSAHDPHKDFELHYIYPEDLLEFARTNLSRNVKLKQGKIPYDFTVFVYRNK
ncbi:MAG: hypothetical protein ACW99F_20305, partial [Candidatus Hodarchaeales archaeon]